MDRARGEDEADPMFATGSPYSPFFISGLLSASRPDDRSFLSLHLSLPSPPRTSLPLRRSHDSLRTIPSPKPAPSTTLPDLPKSSPPRLPSIPIGPSFRLSLARASHSAPALLSVKRDSTASVSPSVRNINRSHALARLEGRTKSTRRKPKSVKRNFMSMSDEESEAEADDDTDRVHNEPRRFTLSVIDEPEDLVLPMPLSDSIRPPRPFLSSVRTRSTSPRKRQTMTKDWFPLKSFIDLHPADDDLTKFTWRSFIEVSRLS